MRVNGGQRWTLYTLSTLKVPGRDIELYCETAGSGPPCILVHVFEHSERLRIFHGYPTPVCVYDLEVEGTGLGLALSKHLVDVMGGRITAVSRMGEGSTFTVEMAAVDGFDAGAESLSDQPPPAEPPRGRLHTVLYVEDNLLNIQLVQRVMGRVGNVQLITAMQGQLALDLAREHRPDVILLDLNLPDLSGEAVLRRLPSLSSARTPFQAVSPESWALGPRPTSRSRSASRRCCRPCGPT